MTAAISAASVGAGRDETAIGDDLAETVIPLQTKMLFGDRAHEFRVTSGRPAGQSAPSHQHVAGGARIVAGAAQKMSIAQRGFVLAPTGQIHCRRSAF